MFWRIHFGTHRALEVPGELVHVGERSLDPEHVRGVNPRDEPESEGLVPVLGAPHVGRAHPEGLALGEGQAREERLDTIPGLPGLCK